MSVRSSTVYYVNVFLYNAAEHMFHCQDESSGIQHRVASFKQNDVSEARTASIIRTMTEADARLKRRGLFQQDFTEL
jgi:hypothetical protein